MNGLFLQLPEKVVVLAFLIVCKIAHSWTFLPPLLCRTVLFVVLFVVFTDSSVIAHYRKTFKQINRVWWNRFDIAVTLDMIRTVKLVYLHYWLEIHVSDCWLTYTVMIPNNGELHEIENNHNKFKLTICYVWILRWNSFFKFYFIMNVLPGFRFWCWKNACL